MKTKVISLFILAVTFLASPAFAIDQVKLNNGQTVEGTVLNDIPNRYVDIRLINGDTKRFEKSEVASVERDVPSRKDRDQFGNQSLGFVALNAGGYYNLDNPANNNVLFDYGVKAGFVTGASGDTKIGFALSYDRNSRSFNAFGVGATTVYNDLNLQMLFMRLANSGFYFGPNVGLAIFSTSYDSGAPGYSNSNFEVGASAGYEAYLTDSFSIGPDVRYEHVFGDSPTKLNALKFTLQGTIHL